MKFSMKVLQTLVDKAMEGYVPDNPYVNAMHDASTKLVGHTQPYYPLFYLIAKQWSPNFVLELGSWRAYGASHFAAGNPAGKVATIDIHREDKEAQRMVLEFEKHLKNMKYFNSWTWDALPLLQAHYGADFKIDIMFIDAWHTKECVEREWATFSPFLADDAMIICDDLFNDPGVGEMMVEWWDEFKQNPCIKETFTHSGLHPGIPLGFARYAK